MKFNTTTYPDHYELGSVVRTHGVKGDLLVYLDADEPERYKKMKAVWVEEKDGLKEFKVTKSSIVEKQAIIHLEGIEDMTAAEGYLKKRLFMPLSFLPKLKGKQFYFHEIIGYTVVDT